MKRAMIVSLALILVLSAVAMADGIGAFSAFKNGVGARALAMGGAFVAVANDATAACWNPAGLATLNDTRLAGMSTDLYGLGAYAPVRWGRDDDRQPGHRPWLGASGD